MTIEEFLEAWEAMLKLVPPITMEELADALQKFDELR